MCEWEGRVVIACVGVIIKLVVVVFLTYDGDG